MTDNHAEQSPVKPKIWAVGGGKGGVGKSVLSSLFALWLAQIGKRTIIVDVDLGGANIHTLLGIKSPTHTINDFITKKVGSLGDICIETGVPNLRLLSGASEILSLANLQFAQKVKIIQGIGQLDAEYVVLDLGAGTSFNVLDFFLIAHRQIVMLTPQPISIQNSYAFVRNAVYRKLSRLTSQKPGMLSIIKSAMDPKNELNVRTVKELFRVIRDDGGAEAADFLKGELATIRPALVTNMVRSRRDNNAGSIIRLVSEKYLMIEPVDMGGVVYDKRLNSLVSSMTPLSQIDRSSEAFAGVHEITSKLL
ncbi:MAG: P-loop NTPase [Deltaproteobacteria bacterium]|nr:P-loop NTPase [Deltaproteobacteria bacterium]